MIIITVREFRANQKKYFDLAELERVVIKRGKKLISLLVSDKLPNPSPSGDDFFENQENITHVLQGIEQAQQGKGTVYSLEELKRKMGI